jgi:hypothetical protein
MSVIIGKGSYFNPSKEIQLTTRVYDKVTGRVEVVISFLSQLCQSTDLKFVCVDIL